MDWFRWWHGSLTDPKFQWVAKKSGHGLATVIALWVAILEHASTVTHGDAGVTNGDESPTRGSIAGLDCESLDVLFDLDDGSCASILASMEAKGLIADGRVANWERRQPRREDSSAERTREYRARKRAEKSGDAPTNIETSGDACVTHCDAPDKSREEEIRTTDTSVVHECESASTSSTPRARPKSKSRKTPLPAGFAVSDRVAAWAEDKGHRDLDRHLEAFVAKCRARGYQYVDWDAAFMEAIRQDWAGLGRARDAPRGQKFDPVAYVNRNRMVNPDGHDSASVIDVEAKLVA
ncbi:hypothetical protein [Cupriavidus gilardii]|uniref:hypothetical protein n=1 Tax=Cupriavidus gilardii TaxID=82541 RepID=UPI0021B2436D|nr:hypothetical protein [Cupriavidus gilardii]UXC38266.1 hypothetical protein N4G38_24710 [Cupriavidus gilardii]